MVPFLYFSDLGWLADTVSKRRQISTDWDFGLGQTIFFINAEIDQYVSDFDDPKTILKDFCGAFY